MNVPFHITFQSQCFTVIGCDAAISTTDTGGVDEAVYISDWSLTQFRVSISSDRNTISYIAFGIQQWGYYEAASTLTVTLPIAFTTTDYAITLSPKTKSDAFGHRWKDKTLVSFGVDRISGVSTPGNYHAIGW